MQDELPHPAGPPQAHPRGAFQGVPPLPHLWEDLQRPLHAGAAHGDPRWREALQLRDLQQGLPGDRSFPWALSPDCILCLRPFCGLWGTSCLQTGRVAGSHEDAAGSNSDSPASWSEKVVGLTGAELSASERVLLPQGTHVLQALLTLCVKGQEDDIGCVTLPRRILFGTIIIF